MNGYPTKFIDNAMKTSRSVRKKTESQSSLSLPYIGSAPLKFERILKEVGIQVYHSSLDKLFRSLFSHKDRLNEFQKPGVYHIPYECGLVYTGETGQNLSLCPKEHRTVARKPKSKNQPLLNTRGLLTIA